MEFRKSIVYNSVFIGFRMIAFNAIKSYESYTDRPPFVFRIPIIWRRLAPYGAIMLLEYKANNHHMFGINEEKDENLSI